MIEDWRISKEKIIPWSLNLDTSNFELMVNNIGGYSNGLGLEVVLSRVQLTGL